MKNWKRYWLPRLIAHTAKFMIRLILCTCRVRIRGLDLLNQTVQESSCILMLWHDKLVILPEILHHYTSDFSCTAFISKSRDGDPLALVTESYPRGRVLRVPHNARHKALCNMIDLLKKEKGVVLITPDGPRGPRHVVKPGVVVAARESGAKIIPFSWKADRFWQLNTWDQMQIPKPFSRVEVIFGKPVVLSKTTENSIEQDVELLMKRMEENLS